MTLRCDSLSHGYNIGVCQSVSLAVHSLVFDVVTMVRARGSYLLQAQDMLWFLEALFSSFGFDPAKEDREPRATALYIFILYNTAFLPTLVLSLRKTVR